MTSPPTTVIGARKALGELLAQHRVASKFGQHGFVDALSSEGVYLSRSSIANIEVGRQRPNEDLCSAADKLCGAKGEITRAYHELERLEAHMSARNRSARNSKGHQADQLMAQVPLDAVVRRALGDGSDPPVRSSSLESRVISAHQQLQPDRHLSLTVVGGFAGSGKSEFGRFLSNITGWAFLDKDTLTRPLVEQLLFALGGDRDDRNSELYQFQVRPHEYRCLMDTVNEALSCGVSTVVAAPFLRELNDSDFLARLRNNSDAKGAALSIIWVQCDTVSMFDYLSYRGAARDRWKLTNWEDYLDTIDLEFRPRIPHHVVDNRLNATSTLIDQAHHIATRIRRAP